MVRMKLRAWVAFVLPLAVAGVAVACGARTGLFLPEEEFVTDAGGDGTIVRKDAADSDADEAATLDALPPIDVTPPPPDAPNPCTDAGSTPIYVITQNNNLMSFDPPSGAFTRIGSISCPGVSSGLAPFSMAVDQNGIAFVVSTSGELFRVSTATALCQATGFVMGQGGFPTTFGMGFVRDPSGMTETLYVAGDIMQGPLNPGGLCTLPSILGGIDPGTLKLDIVGTFRPHIYCPELTGTAAGDLFAFYAPNQNDMISTAIGQIDKTTGQVVAQSPLPGVEFGYAWAFAFWGGEFYVFTEPNGLLTPSIVTRFRPLDNSIMQVAKADETIVGAGVSTCAPQN
jgi:hypothetical protein